MTKIHEKVWGYEDWIINTPLYCSKILYLNKGWRCSLHYHKEKDETFYLLEGRVFLELESDRDFDNMTQVMKIGDTTRVHPFLLHRFTGLMDSKILEISTQHFDEDSYRLEPSGKANPYVMKRYS